MPSVASEAVAFSHRGPEPRRRSDPPTTAHPRPFATLLDSNAAPSDQPPPPHADVDRPAPHRAEAAHKPARDANDTKDTKDAKSTKDAQKSDASAPTDANATQDDTGSPATEASGDQTGAAGGNASEDGEVTAANGDDPATAADGGKPGADTAAVDAALAEVTAQPAPAPTPAPAAPTPAVAISVAPIDPNPQSQPIEIAKPDLATAGELAALTAPLKSGAPDKPAEVAPPKVDLTDKSQKPAMVSAPDAAPAPAAKTDLAAAHNEISTVKEANEATDARDAKDAKSAKNEAEQKSANLHGSTAATPTDKPSDAPRLVHAAADNAGTTGAQAAQGANTNVRPDALPNLSLAPANTSAVAPTNTAPVSAPPLATIIDAVPLAGLAVEIASRASAGQKSFEIRLDPPELGRIDVRLDLDRHGSVSSHLVVDRPETLDLLRRDQTSLERALQSAGLKTDGGLQFSLRDQNFAGRDQPDDTFVGTRLVVPDEEIAPKAHSRTYGRFYGLGGGIDIRV